MTEPMRVRPLLVLVVLALAVLPWLPVSAFWITQMNYIGLYSLVVLGLLLLTGVGGLTSFGQSAFVGLGAYCTAWLTTAVGVSPWFGLVAGLLLTCLVAYVLGAITLRLSGHYLPLCTLAWCLALFYLYGNLDFLGRYDGIASIPPITLGGWSLGASDRMYMLIWLILLLALWGTHNLLDSRAGRAIRALRSGAMAESFGVDLRHYKVVIFVYAALLGGVSGWLYAHMQRAVSPSPFGLGYGIEYLFMAVVGGSGSVWGAVVGTATILIVKDQLQNVLPGLIGTSANLELLAFGVLMILVLQFARDGLWPVLARGWERVVGADRPRRAAAAPAVGAAELPRRARLILAQAEEEIPGGGEAFGRGGHGGDRWNSKRRRTASHQRRHRDTDGPHPGQRGPPRLDDPGTHRRGYRDFGVQPSSQSHCAPDRAGDRHGLPCHRQACRRDTA